MPPVSKRKLARKANLCLARETTRKKTVQNNTTTQFHDKSTDDKENEAPSKPLMETPRNCANINSAMIPDQPSCSKEVVVVFQPILKPLQMNKCVQTDRPVVKRKHKQKSNTDMVGRRVDSLASLIDAVTVSSSHSSICPKGPVLFDKESNVGLASKITFVCGCGKKFEMDSDKNMKLAVNDSLVWGNTQSSVGYQSSRHLITTLGMLPPSYNLYKKLQDNFFGDMEKALQVELQQCAKIETDLASQAGEFVFIEGEKYPAITVTLDGGWGKPSYGHSFSSKYGVAVIIGSKTGKVLFMDTRISHCHICDTSRLSKSKSTDHGKTW